MLILSRRVRQAVVLSWDGVTLAKVTVTRIEGGQVQLGFECPPDVKVLRAELRERDQETDDDASVA